MQGLNDPDAGGGALVDSPVTDGSDALAELNDKVADEEVPRWGNADVERWAHVVCGTSVEDARVAGRSNGTQLLNYPVYPLDELREDLAERGMGADGVEAVVNAYKMQRWLVDEQVGMQLCVLRMLTTDQRSRVCCYLLFPHCAVSCLCTLLGAYTSAPTHVMQLAVLDLWDIRVVTLAWCAGGIALVGLWDIRLVTLAWCAGGARLDQE